MPVAETSVVSLLRVLADPTRLRVLALLSQAELSVGEIARSLAMGQSRVSNHLKVLREAGLIEVERDGRRRLYRLNPEPLKRVVGDWLACFDAQGAAAPSS